jgi:predicted RNase H-like nuclease (RuvC/YqgF family)
MTDIKTETVAKVRRKPGPAPRFSTGRINASTRFTPERHAVLKAAAIASGRSLSEQIEFEIEEGARKAASLAKFERDEQFKLTQISDHLDQIGRQQQRIRELEQRNRELEAKAQSADTGMTKIAELERRVSELQGAVATFSDGVALRVEAKMEAAIKRALDGRDK